MKKNFKVFSYINSLYFFIEVNDLQFKFYPNTCFKLFSDYEFIPPKAYYWYTSINLFFDTFEINFEDKIISLYYLNEE